MASKPVPRIRKLWQYLKCACTRPTATDYASFGGKGVQWCDRWMSFDEFLADVGEPPSDRHRLRRIDENEGYSPSNVRWVYIVGWHKTRVYTIWMKMRARCYNSGQRGYQRYGGRGVKVCDRWHKFENFLADMGEPPTDKHSLDRYPNNDGDYEPSNCRWATQSEQMRNTSLTIFLELDGENLCLDDWATRLGINKKTLHGRLREGWSVEKTLTTPIIKQPTTLSSGQQAEIKKRYIPWCSKNGVKPLAREFKVRSTRIAELVEGLDSSFALKDNGRFCDCCPQVYITQFIKESA